MDVYDIDQEYKNKKQKEKKKLNTERKEIFFKRNVI